MSELVTYILVDDDEDIIDEVNTSCLALAVTHFKRNLGRCGCNHLALHVYEYKKSFPYEVVE